MEEWECPECGMELVALDTQALAPHVRDHLEDHSE